MRDLLTIEDCVEYFDYRDLLQKAPNKIGFLVLAFKRLHGRAPIEDFETNTCGAKISAIYKKMNKDAGTTLGLIWDTSRYFPCGSHLDYMMGVISQKKKANMSFTDKSNDHAGMEVIR